MLALSSAGAGKEPYVTIGEYSQIYRGKRVVNFSMGDTPAGGDVVYRLTQDYDSAESQRDLLDNFLSQVDPSQLEALIIGAWSEAQEEGPDGYLDGLIERRAQLPALKALFIGDMTYEDCEISWIIQTSYNPLLTAFPNLQSLRIRGSTNLELQAFGHDALEELAIECGGLPSNITDAIAASTLPALNHLELWLGSDGYGFDGGIAPYQNLLAKIDPRRLRYLGLRDSEISDELAVWLAQQPWLGSLQTLDLSLGTIGDVGAQALAESPHLGTIERIDLSHHYISPPWQQKLQALPCTVVLDDHEDEDDGDRYVAVSE
ncbi:leucine Rich repeat family protein [Lysobacter gummosus]|nr:leucine Rich repeat family protein [Lysobacter gummosus]